MANNSIALLRKRLWAIILDVIFLTATLNILFAILYPIESFFNIEQRHLAIINIIIYATIWFAYFVYFTGIYGQTIGKFLANIFVVASNGGKIDLAISLKRYLLLIGNGIMYISSFVFILIKESFDLYSLLMIIVCAIGFVDIFVALFNKYRKTLHDYIGGTIVVNTGANVTSSFPLSRKNAKYIMWACFVIYIIFQVLKGYYKMQYMNQL